MSEYTGALTFKGWLRRYLGADGRDGRDDLLGASPLMLGELADDVLHDRLFPDCLFPQAGHLRRLRSYWRASFGTEDAIFRIAVLLWLRSERPKEPRRRLSAHSIGDLLSAEGDSLDDVVQPPPPTASRWGRWIYDAALKTLWHEDEKYEIDLERITDAQRALDIVQHISQKGWARERPEITGHLVLALDDLFHVQRWCHVPREKSAKLARKTIRPASQPEPLSLKLRFTILSRDKFRCRYCGTAGVELHVDHVVSRRDGGTDDPTNLVTACVPCNLGKGHRSAKLPDRER